MRCVTVEKVRSRRTRDRGRSFRLSASLPAHRATAPRTAGQPGSRTARQPGKAITTSEQAGHVVSAEASGSCGAGKDTTVPSEFRTSTPAGGDAPDSEPRPDLSRRSVLRRAAGASVAGLAASAIVGAAGPAFAAAARPAQRRPRRDPADPAAAEGHAAQDLVVHVRDARSGEMDVFSGTSQIRLRDKDLAARLMRAIG
jgi:hypothetical protein